MSGETKKPTQKRRTIHPYSVRKRAVVLNGQGWGAKRIARVLNVDSSTVKVWLRRYKTYGEPCLHPWWHAPRTAAEGIPANGRSLSKRNAKSLAGFARRASHYEQAVKMFSTLTLSCSEVSRRCGLNYQSLYRHLRINHPDLFTAYKEAKRTRRRQEAIEYKAQVAARAAARRNKREEEARIRAIQAEERTLNRGKRPSQAIAAYYAEAVEMYRTSDFSVMHIARITGVDASSLRHHLKKWHSDLVASRHLRINPRHTAEV